MHEISSLKKPTRTETMRRASEFQRAYDMLNPSQRKAVDTIEGPVMVLAGPGTGKTQVLALRTANILKKTHMRAGNILCLTFSLSGATNMRERLRSYIGPDAYSITVSTFHGFCNDLILDHPLVFDDWAAREQVSDTERYRIVNSVIDSLGANLSLVSKKDPHGRTGQILSRISQLKREGKTDVAFLEDICKQYDTRMETKSKEGTKQHEKNVLAAKKFRDLITVFHAYQEALKKSNRYDYDDMLLYCIEALKEHDWLLASLQERYQYILVDEFQDTNGAQAELLRLLTTYENLDVEPNLFVVGDDDQAIYRFQGANVQNLVDFTQRFPSREIITLTTSYRCPQSVLDAAGSVIQNNTERLVGKVDGIEKNLTSHSSPLAPCPLPLLIKAPSDTTEPWLIADIIEERMEQGVDIEDIAILVQKNSELLTLFDVLSSRNIPAEIHGKLDLLASPLVVQLLRILRSVENLSTSSNCAAALSCECFSVHPADLGRLFSVLREANTPLLDVLLALDPESSHDFHDILLLIEARDILLDLSQRKDSRMLTETIERCMKDTGLIEKAQHPLHPLEFAALQEFFTRAKNRCYEEPSLTLTGLLNDIEYRQVYPELRWHYSLPHLKEGGVQVMTAHQSKGLEFNTVILSHFRTGHWDSKRSPSTVSAPEDLLFGWNTEATKEQKQEDERRLTFVAMTRAKKELIFTCPEVMIRDGKTREVSPSAFFAEAGELPEVSKELREPEKASELLFEPVLVSDEIQKTFLKKRVSEFSLSVTALNHFLEDPALFVERDLLQVPQSKKPSLVYGNAVHDALRKWALARMNPEVSPRAETRGLDEFMSSFRDYLEHREILTDLERERLLALGEENLPRYFDACLTTSSSYIYKIEHAIHAHAPWTGSPDDPIRLKGKIDRIDLLSPESSQAIVIDYKTGKPKSENAIREGDYFRQLAFYALLIEHQKGLLIEPIEYVLDFIGEGTDHPVQRRFSVTESEKKELCETVDAVWTKIQNLDFSPL